MKRIFGIFIMAALVVGCSEKYEDSDAYKEFMESLEDAQANQEQIAEQITTLAGAIEALEARQAALNSVTAVEAILDEESKRLSATRSASQAQTLSRSTTEQKMVAMAAKAQQATMVMIPTLFR